VSGVAVMAQAFRGHGAKRLSRGTSIRGGAGVVFSQEMKRGAQAYRTSVKKRRRTRLLHRTAGAAGERYPRWAQEGNLV
jgi:hypothetical protein